jgi:homoserine kinase type II
MTDNSFLEPILAAWTEMTILVRIESLGSAGGFSGATFWRVETPMGPFCLRRWPREHPSLERLQFIHAVLTYAANRGISTIPVPLPTHRKNTFVRYDRQFWELSSWLPGAPTEPAETGKRIPAALTALAEFHRTVEAFPRESSLSGEGPAPGIVKRRERLKQLTEGELDELTRSIVPQRWPAGVNAASRLVELFPKACGRVETALVAASALAVSRQPCLRDVWSDHLLFTGAKVTGIIDFGALDWENVAADVARLLGSMAGDDLLAWQRGLAAYEAVRPLAEEERQLIAAFDHSQTLLGGLNWIDWIYRQQRPFEGLDRVLARLQQYVRRMESLVAGNDPFSAA